MAEETTREDPAVLGGKHGGPIGGRHALYSLNVSASELQLYLKGVDYPVDKNELVHKAEENNAPENVMEWIRKLPERTYDRPNHVEEEFGKLK
jgi:hypothetical protein